MTDPADDPRWRRLTDPDRACPCCGERFGGVFDLHFAHPDPWPHGPIPADGSTELAVGDDRLTPATCEYDLHRFLRAPLALPIQGTGAVFRFHVWGSVAFDRYYAYRQSLEDPDVFFPGCTAWIANRLPGFDAISLPPATFRVGGPGKDPQFVTRSGPLSNAQKKGIAFDTLLDIYAAAGRDIRPHLTQD